MCKYFTGCYYLGIPFNDNGVWKMRFNGLDGEEIIRVREWDYPLLKDDMGSIVFSIKTVYEAPAEDIHINMGSDVPYAFIFVPTYKDFNLFDRIKTKDYNDKEFIIVGIREKELELEVTTKRKLIKPIWYPISKCIKKTQNH